MIDWFMVGYADATSGRLPRPLYSNVRQCLTPNMIDNYVKGYNYGTKERVPKKFRN